MSDRALIEALTARLGAGALRTDEDARALAASDLYMTGERPAAVVVPADAAQVAEAIRVAAALGYAVVPRGGGLSYTGGYAPPCAKAITIDMRAMNRILDIAEEDMVITVQAGTTWKQIYDALKPRGLRLPFFGTFSGAGATVGGGLSHGALFFGSARHGSAADIVLGMEVALTDGTLLRTGQGALSRPAKPVMRGFGPDLTGLFTHDGGMLGIKTEASFRMIRVPAEQDHASFAFATLEEAADALSEIARADLAEEVYILDPGAADALPADTATKAKSALSVAREAGGALKAAKALASLAKGGTGFIPAGHFSLHLTAAGRIAAAVRADIEAATRISIGRGGVPIAPTIPRVARAALFADLNGVIGPKGGRWAALNAKVAHSEARRLIGAFEALLVPHAEEMAAHEVHVTRLVSALGTCCFSFEAVFHWRDGWLPLHRAAADPRHLAGFAEAPANPAARALVDRLRRETAELFRECGAASNQIGRTYPFREALSLAPDRLLSAIKQALDPQGLMNPGVLGFA